MKTGRLVADWIADTKRSTDDLKIDKLNKVEVLIKLNTMFNIQCSDCSGTGYIRIGLKQVPCEKCKTKGHIPSDDKPHKGSES